MPCWINFDLDKGTLRICGAYALRQRQYQESVIVKPRRSIWGKTQARATRPSRPFLMLLLKSAFVRPGPRSLFLRPALGWQPLASITTSGELSSIANFREIRINDLTWLPCAAPTKRDRLIDQLGPKGISHVRDTKIIQPDLQELLGWMERAGNPRPQAIDHPVAGHACTSVLRKTLHVGGTAPVVFRIRDCVAKFLRQFHMQVGS
jgi:hypothetical protein